MSKLRHFKSKIDLDLSSHSSSHVKSPNQSSPPPWGTWSIRPRLLSSRARSIRFQNTRTYYASPPQTFQRWSLPNAGHDRYQIDDVQILATGAEVAICRIHSSTTHYKCLLWLYHRNKRLWFHWNLPLLLRSGIQRGILDLGLFGWPLQYTLPRFQPEVGRSLLEHWYLPFTPEYY